MCKGLWYGDINSSVYSCLVIAPSSYYDYINISGGGPDYAWLEAREVARLTNAGSVIIAAAGNDNKELTSKNKFYPASYKMDGYINVLAVGKGIGIS